MTAYVIADVHREDREKLAQYLEKSGPTVERHGGRFLAYIGAEIDHVEGDWCPTNLVVLEFPSLARAREWYTSDAYAAALAVRGGALDRSLVFVAGADES